MEQIGTCPCLYEKSKMSYKERDVNRNAWCKVAEKLNFIQNLYKCRHEKLGDCCGSPITKNRRVWPSLSGDRKVSSSRQKNDGYFFQ